MCKLSLHFIFDIISGSRDKGYFPYRGSAINVTHLEADETVVTTKSHTLCTLRCYETFGYSAYWFDPVLKECHLITGGRWVMTYPFTANDQEPVNGNPVYINEKYMGVGVLQP